MKPIGYGIWRWRCLSGLEASALTNTGVRNYFTIASFITLEYLLEVYLNIYNSIIRASGVNDCQQVDQHLALLLALAATNPNRVRDMFALT
jgi:DNA-binding GntR family transcriptional regulator